MLNELSGSLSSCILLWVFSTLPVQRSLAKDFLDKAEGFKQANQLFPSLCAHAPGRNSILQVPASEQSSRSLLEHLRLRLCIYWVIDVLPWARFQRSNPAWYFVKANCLEVIPCSMLQFTSDKQMGIHLVDAFAWLPWDFAHWIKMPSSIFHCTEIAIA